MKEEGTFQSVFYDGRIRTPEDFLEIMKKPANLPVFVFRGLDLIGVAWLNGLSGAHGFAHFCMLKGSWGRDSVKACQLFLEYWMSFMSGGEPVFHVLLGVIQKTNARAIRFVEKLGFVRLGAIPAMLRDAYEGAWNDAIVLYYVRKDHGRWRR